MSEPLEVWETDGLIFSEMVRQPYTNCVFAAGYVDGHPVDTIYLRWERGDDGGMLMLRPDEAAALGWLLNGMLWSVLVQVDE